MLEPNLWKVRPAFAEAASCRQVQNLLSRPVRFTGLNPITEKKDAYFSFCFVDILTRL